LFRNANKVVERKWEIIPLKVRLLGWLMTETWSDSVMGQSLNLDLNMIQ
jgi:hypothetical protein